ncbi:MAG TPA: hypothetical protein VGM39_12505 [Kofleriaceae bacterium]|jgi:hypothetical protein
MLRYSAFALLLVGCTNSGSGDDGTCIANTEDTTVNSAAIEGRYLHLNVGFGGGCEEHDFALTWSGGAGASDPPVVEVTLKHDGHGDMCEAYGLEDLYFDLSSIDSLLAQGGGGPARIVLEGVSSENAFALTYTPGQPDAPPNADVLALQHDCAY